MVPGFRDQGPQKTFRQGRASLSAGGCRDPVESRRGAKEREPRQLDLKLCCLISNDKTVPE
jgi:hypothetical protein